MREVADKAGVAMSSVSRVLSNHPDVSPAMRTRVAQAVDELGYEPDILAQSLRRKRTLTVGFVVGDISNPLLAQIAMGAEAALRESGYSMLLTNSENDPELDARHVHLLRQRRVDGLLLSTASEDSTALFEALEAFEGPVVLIDRELPGRLGANAVLSDHRGGMRDAVGHLLDLGHRRVGLILGQPLRFSRERRLGLEDAYRERGVEETFTVLEGRLSPEHGRSATRELLAAAQPPTAVVAGGNQILLGTLEEIHERGLALGSELSLVSCDAISLTELHEPPIAVVRRDTREIGRRAGAVLLRHLGDETAAREEVILPTQFVARASCGKPLAPG
jgi:LacI family transcriptional regulator, galactose operon repressor